LVVSVLAGVEELPEDRNDRRLFGLCRGTSQPVDRSKIQRQRLFPDVVLVDQAAIDAFLKQRQVNRVPDPIPEVMLVIVQLIP
jgi:hypothetical protein